MPHEAGAWTETTCGVKGHKQEGRGLEAAHSGSARDLLHPWEPAHPCAPTSSSARCCGCVPRVLSCLALRAPQDGHAQGWTRRPHEKGPSGLTPHSHQKDVSESSGGRSGVGNTLGPQAETPAACQPVSCSMSLFRLSCRRLAE